MLKKNFLINKNKFSLIILIFIISINQPFTFLYEWFGPEVKLALMLFAAIFISNKIINKKKSFRFLLVAGSFILFYFIRYFLLEAGNQSSLIIHVINLFFMLTTYLFITTKLESNYVINKFINVSAIISIISILAYVGFTTNLIPFSSQEVAGHNVNFNYLFGSIKQKEMFYQAHYYFTEPSYFGFFLGFSFFFILPLNKIKYHKLKLLLILIAGIILYSFTFYVGLIIGLVAFVTFKFLKPFLNVRKISTIFLFFFISISILSYQYLITYKGFFQASSSFDQRSERIELSLATIDKMNFNEYIYGKGTGYIKDDNSRNIAESNAYIKLFVENGAVFVIIYLLIIYFLLRDNPPLLIFTLATLHAVVILETPLFILLISLASIPYNYNLPNTYIIKNE